jgi:hypothetical protein
VGLSLWSIDGDYEILVRLHQVAPIYREMVASFLMELGLQLVTDFPMVEVTARN